MKKKGAAIVCLTAYDALDASLADLADVDLVLVGDSVGNARLGMSDTLGVSLEMILHHVRAVRRGLKHALLVADLPFGSYQVSTEQAIDAAIQCIKAGAEAVKLEGPYDDAVQGILKAGIPVMGHLGMTPQSVHQFGGFRVQGKQSNHADRIRQEAKLLEESGVFAVVLELIPGDLATMITQEIAIPTIGIGAGVGCDGQIQVLTDVLGLSEGTFKHAKPYLHGRELLANALKQYTEEVRARSFPTSENTF